MNTAFPLGLWLASATDAVAAGWAADRTPFDGRPGAGNEVLNTASLPEGDGPIGRFSR